MGSSVVSWLQCVVSSVLATYIVLVVRVVLGPGTPASGADFWEFRASLFSESSLKAKGVLCAAKFGQGLDVRKEVKRQSNLGSREWQELVLEQAAHRPPDMSRFPTPGGVPGPDEPVLIRGLQAQVIGDFQGRGVSPLASGDFSLEMEC